MDLQSMWIHVKAPTCLHRAYVQPTCQARTLTLRYMWQGLHQEASLSTSHDQRTQYTQEVIIKHWQYCAPVHISKHKSV